MFIGSYKSVISIYIISMQISTFPFLEIKFEQRKTLFLTFVYINNRISNHALINVQINPKGKFSQLRVL